MKRYHRKIYFPDIEKLKKLNSSFIGKSFSYSRHAIDTMKYRHTDTQKILQYIKDTELNADDIFEYYKNDNGDIVKVCYRISYTQNNDIILVVSSQKNIVTVYTNEKNDDHVTLNGGIYEKE